MRKAETVLSAREEEMSRKCVPMYTCMAAGIRVRCSLSLKNAEVLIYACCGLVLVARCSLVASRAYAGAPAMCKVEASSTTFKLSRA